jgi:hypothetical protein
MAEGQMTRYQPPAPSTPPAGLDLERRLLAVIGDAHEATAAELRALLEETEAAIIAAEQAAILSREQAFDPQRAPDPVAARDQMENASLLVGRLQTLHSRLQRRVTAVEAAEHFRQWQCDFRDLKKEHDSLAKEFAQVYPTVCAQLFNLFGRLGSFDRRASQLHQRRPAGCSLHIESAELTARKLERFTRDEPSLPTVVQLFALDGKQVWPPKVARDMSLFAPVVIADAAHSPDWWRPEVQAARNAEAKAEADRVAQYYEQQNKQREEREKNAAKP